MLHLITGGARSGKSRFAEHWLLEQHRANNHKMPAVYLASAQAFDDEMKLRIEQHQLQRLNQNWRLIEAPYDIDHALSQVDDGEYVLFDCLTLWLSNQLISLGLSTNFKDKQLALSDQVEVLVKVLDIHAQRLTIAVVSNEVGLGVVPLGEDNRLFVDHAGWLNQQVATNAQRVTLVTAGIPLTIKGNNNG